VLDGDLHRRRVARQIGRTLILSRPGHEANRRSSSGISLLALKKDAVRFTAVRT
jgi:hypothetical protein